MEGTTGCDLAHKLIQLTTGKVLTICEGIDTRAVMIYHSLMNVHQASEVLDINGLAYI